MRFFTAILTVLAVVGCSEADRPAVEHQAAGAEAEMTEAVSKGDEAVELPGSVKLTAQLHLRSDEINPTPSGAMRRRVVYELLDVEPEDSYAAIRADFERAGFAPSKRKKRKDGGFTVAFRKDGMEPMNILFYPGVARNPANVQAKSMIAIGWNVAEPPR